MAEDKTEEPKEKKGEETPPEKEPAEEEPETEETGGIEIGKIGNLFSPEAVIMLPLAILLDLIGVILICFGLDDFGITDIFGILLFGSWMYFRSQTIAVPEKLKKRAETGLRKLFRGPWKRFLTPIIGEVIPYVGVLPMWTLAVYYELTS